jgi:hypothetical protein
MISGHRAQGKPERKVYDGREDVARVVRDALQPCAVPPPSARPRCGHGRTEGHLYRPMPGPPMGVWCPGPRTQPEPARAYHYYYANGLHSVEAGAECQSCRAGGAS